MTHRCRFVLALLLLGLTRLFPGVPVRAGESSAGDFFETAIRPLLVSRCQSCHGAEKPKSGLSLTSRAAMLRGGKSGPAVVPGKPEESLLIEVIHYESEPRMPPKARLTDPEIAALTRWVELGVPWPESSGPPGPPAPTVGSGSGSSAGDASGPHWAFQPVRPVRPPDLADDAWSRNPLDRFVLARLRQEGLAPSPPADRRTLIRRLSVDLTGLPPTSAEVEAFLADDRPDAAERLIDRLLASPHHGEQWARHWLDVARYSDTKGYVYAREESRWVHAWAYRDWVVRAFNEDLPYDRFLLLQLAADQVADDPRDLPAMGFLTLGRRFLGVTHDIIDDRIDVVTRGTLGLTVACARCHDHKYDPIPTSDYYSLYGVFRNATERVVPAFRDAEARPAESPFEKGLRERRQTLEARLKQERTAAADRVRKRVTEYLLAQFEMHKYPEEGFDQLLAPDDLFPSFVRRWREALHRAGLRGDPVFSAWHAFTSVPAEAFSSRSAEITESLRQAPAERVNPLIAQAFATPPATPREVAERYGAVFGTIIAAWDDALAQAKKDQRPAPDGLPDPAAEAIRRVLYGPDSPCEVPDEPIVSTEWFFPTDTTVALWKLQGDVDRWLIQQPEAPAYATILVDRTAITEPRVFRRGNPATPGEEIRRHFLQALSGPQPRPFEKGSGRLELARAIVDPANPLTARVLVNRVWMHHFGAGLVSTPGDFGRRADPPSHPELLDWLAARFIADGWSLKALHRLIVTSATYQQAASGPADPAVREQAERRDPENRWLWRARPHRLTFEELRDALLAASGDLDRRLGGKPADLLKPPFASRRALYGFIDRENFPTLYRSFDVANPDLLIPQRNETTIPQQALFFLNNPFVLERARAILQRPEIAGAADPADKVRGLYRLLYQREPTPSQREAALALVRAGAAEPVPAPPPGASAWSYGYGRYDEQSGRVVGFQPLPHHENGAWQGGPAWPDPTLGWVQLTPEGGHAGNDRAHAAVRRWTAPRDATLRLRSTLHHDVAAGDGVRGFLCSSRQGTIQKAEVHHASVEFNVDELVVQAGDTLDFVVDLRGNLNNDQFRWAPTLTTLTTPEPMTWDARADFQGPPLKQLDAWEQLAQVLLMANEYSFLD